MAYLMLKTAFEEAISNRTHHRFDYDYNDLVMSPEVFQLFEQLKNLFPLFHQSTEYFKTGSVYLYMSHFS